ncbi:hypothetical protein EYF80_040866 [Liparis tanakae]|uniref:Uncharacterized protein n=1 Tax=Liparis tanakae TaxID=230148 RepID=A0A4Z2G7L9_9TELE|nr:hypothetical protein EYF80_040866 [Liparis tanakae]
MVEVRRDLDGPRGSIVVFPRRIIHSPSPCTVVMRCPSRKRSTLESFAPLTQSEAAAATCSVSSGASEAVTSVRNVQSSLKGCSRLASRIFLMTRTLCGGLFHVSLWLAGS